MDGSEEARLTGQPHLAPRTALALTGGSTLGSACFALCLDEVGCDLMKGNAQEILLINDITWAATFDKNLLLLHIVLSTYEYSLSLSRLNSSFHQLKVAQLSTYRASRALICFHPARTTVREGHHPTVKKQGPHSVYCLASLPLMLERKMSN